MQGEDLAKAQHWFLVNLYLTVTIFRKGKYYFQSIFEVFFALFLMISIDFGVINII